MRSLKLFSFTVSKFILQLSNLINSQDTDRPLPKFGEWDVNDPASAEGYTVIFNKARDEKKTGGKPDSPAKVKPRTRPALDPNKAQNVRYVFYCDINEISLDVYVRIYLCICVFICLFLLCLINYVCNVYFGGKN